MPGEERRETIIHAAQKIFAEKGFHGTTTRELAKEASVSEALLFKHFPNKQAIYLAMLNACRKSQNNAEAPRILALQPSTSTLAVMLHFLVSKLVLAQGEMCIIRRLLLRSLCEDGEFARVLFQHFGSTWIVKFRACVDAAHKAGDLQQTKKLKSGAWLAQHVLLMIAFMHEPSSCAVDYRLSKEDLAEEAVIFCLRGLGLKEEAIKKYYNPQAFALLTV